MTVVIILIIIGGIILAIHQLISRPFIPFYQKTTILDRTVLRKTGQNARIWGFWNSVSIYIG